MSKTTKTSSSETSEKLRKEQEINEDLRKQLLLGPDLLIEKSGSDKSLDARIEKVELISGRILELRPLLKYIDKRINEYSKKFPQEYYREIFRLKGWAIPSNGNISRKPSIVGKFTIDFIYGRFPKEVLPAIETNNPYINDLGIRYYKHFQFLTSEASIKLEKFIKDSIIIMKRCNYWDEFVAEHAKAYGHPFQTSLFN